MAVTPASSHNSSPPRTTNDRSAARLAAVQALYQSDVSGESPDKIIKDFMAGRIGGIAVIADEETNEESTITLADLDTGLFIALVRAVETRGDDIDGIIKGGLSKDWPWPRLETTLRAL
ncbi:MAG: transcription antitermination factor NusB, partial [Rhodospirillaceae bacterium]